VRAVARAVKVLRAFEEGAGEVSVAELARRLGMPVATVYRLVGELERGGLLQRNVATGRYKLGPVMVRLGRRGLEELGLGDAVRAVMVSLQAETGEGVTMAVRYGNWAMYIHQVESRHVLRADLQVGSLVPLHCTAVGKVLLAGSELEEVRRVARETGLPRYTERTITTLAELEVELVFTRARGYSIDNEEFLEGVRCIGAPVLGPGGSVIAAMAVTGPTQRMTDEIMKRLRGRLISAARQASELAGYDGDAERTRRSGANEVVGGISP